MIKTVSFVVKGRVQGVGFRYTTRRAAEHFGLTGWVRNCANGNVEGVAQGENDSIDQFENWLSAGAGACSSEFGRYRSIATSSGAGLYRPALGRIPALRPPHPRESGGLIIPAELLTRSPLSRGRAGDLIIPAEPLRRSPLSRGRAGDLINPLLSPRRPSAVKIITSAIYS